MLAVPKGSEIDSVDDLTAAGVKIAIGSESVPIGSYTREALAKLPPAQEKAILANVRSNEPDVKGIVGKLTQGAVDAGFVYVTDVNAAGEDAERDRAAAAARAAGDLRRGSREEGEAARAGARLRRRAARGRVRRRRFGTRGSARASTLMRWFPVVLAAALAAALTFLTLPVVAIFVDSQPGGAARQPRRAGRPRRPLAEPPHHRDLDGDHPAGRHAGRLPARHALVSRARPMLVTLIELPLVLPPAVAGIALLAAVGPEGMLGGAVEAAGDRAVA